MRYICENDHVFEHSAKKIRPLGDSGTLEIPVCPLCHSPIYSEYVLDKKRIVSVLSVNLDEVDKYLQSGYEVEALYAKTATLVKRKEDRG